MANILSFLGGLGLFIYGVQTTSDGLQKFAAQRFKQVLQSLTNRPFIAALFGVLMTVIFQSSVATTVLVVEFVNVGLMRLAQALGILIGSALGTSIAIQLLAFDMLPLALGLIFAGFLLYFWVGVKRWKSLGQGLIGFGIIFVGMSHMSVSAAPIKNFPEIVNFFSILAAHPLLAIGVGLVLTALFQGGAAIFAVIISLAAQNILSLEAVIPLVIGSHIGGTVMALFSSMTARKMDAKRAALANTGYKVVAGLIALPFLPEFARLVQWTTDSVPRQVANAHLILSLMMLGFLPFNEWIARGLVRFLPDRPGKDALRLIYITDEALGLPAVALKQSFKETAQLGRMIGEDMVAPMRDALLEAGNNVTDKIARAEINVDWYYRHITRFLTTLSTKGLTDEQSADNVNAQFIVKEFEHIGDSLRAMVGIKQKLQQDNLRLQDRDWAQIEELYEKVADNYHLMLKALVDWDGATAGDVIRSQPELIRVQRQLQFEAFGEAGEQKVSGADMRGEEKLRYAKVDLLNLAYGINEHTTNICQVVLGII